MTPARGMSYGSYGGGTWQVPGMVAVYIFAPILWYCINIPYPPWQKVQRPRRHQLCRPTSKHTQHRSWNLACVGGNMEANSQPSTRIRTLIAQPSEPETPSCTPSRPVRPGGRGEGGRQRDKAS
ncbi:hypothetical protein GQ53DRAFT_103234 [Thozetella sp. PMI_491]|nr:hypothetical protein GQ53DRAFT_103234 [Thozetella sp. PMI_491]